MALGTPVAAIAAYSALNGTSITPAFPTGILATDVVVLFVGQKPSIANGGNILTPGGWTLRDNLIQAGGYGTTLGTDTGNTNLCVYTWNTVVAGQTGTQTVLIDTSNVAWAFIVRIPTNGGVISYGSADGQRTTSPGTAPVTLTIPLTDFAATQFKTDDLALWAMCIPTDITTPAQFSAQAITATGATFATAVELNEPDSGTGNDIGGYSAYAFVTSGASTVSPTVSVLVSGTAGNVRGPVLLLRIREQEKAYLTSAPTSSFTATTLPSAFAWSTINYGNGLFVALTNGTQEYVTSPDGTNWTQRKLSVAGSWFSSIYANGLFVALSNGDSNKVILSVDGITWKNSITPVAGNWVGITYGNGRFVAVSNNGTIAVYSFDGYNWAQSALPASLLWSSVTFGNGVFVALATGAGSTAAASSVDGITWVARTLPVGGAWYSVAYGNNIFVALPSDASSTVVATSTNGTTWTPRTLPRAGQFLNIKFNEGLFTILGFNTAIALSSYDGITWIEQSLPVSATWENSSYGNGVIVVVARNTTTAARAKLNGGETTPVGALTTLPSSAELIDTATGTTLVTLDPWVQAGDVAVLMAFRDGSATPPSIEVGNIDPFSQTTLPKAGFLDVVYGNGLFVAVAQLSSTVAISSDGINWTTQTLPVSANWMAIEYGNGVFVAISNNGLGVTSSDGTTWVLQTLPTDFATEALVYGNGIFVAIKGSSNVVITSPDGVTWTTGAMPVSASWEGVAYGNGTFVAVASNSSIGAYSVNGINWTQSALTFSFNWDSIAYGNGLFVAVATGAATFIRSSDGVTWAGGQLPTNTNWTTVIFDNGMFLAVALNNTFAITSVDGINWSQANLPAQRAWHSAAYGNGVFVAIPYDTAFGAVAAYKTWATLDASGSGTSSSLLAYRTLTAGGPQTAGPFANATSVAVAVYRGLDSANPIPGFTLASGTGTTVTLPADTTGETSSVVSFAGHQSPNVTFPASQGGVFRRAQLTDVTDAIVIYDSAGVAV